MITSTPSSTTLVTTVITSETSSVSTDEVSLEEIPITTTLALETETELKSSENTVSEKNEDSIEEVLPSKEPEENQELLEDEIDSNDSEDFAVKAMEELKSKLLPPNPNDDEILAFAAKNWAKKVLNSRGKEVLFREGGLKLPEASDWTYEALHTDSSSLWKLMTRRAENARSVCKDYNQLLEKYSSTKTVLNCLPRVDVKKCKGLGLCSLI